jgi:hypothetical protein
MATVKAKVLMRHPALEDAIPGEVIEIDEKLVKGLEGAIDTHEDAVANPTVVRDDAGNPVDLEFQKQLAKEAAKAAAAKAKANKQ